MRQILVLITAGILAFLYFNRTPRLLQTELSDWVEEKAVIVQDELTIAYLRSLKFPGSTLVIEETLAPGANYTRYIVSYRSQGLKIYGLLTVPTGGPPEEGWPAIVFNHGYIPPAQYKTTERYVAYLD